MTTDLWEHAARAFEPTSSRWPTPGALAMQLNPKTVQTPALDLIDAALVKAASTPDARIIITMAPQEGKSVRVAGDFPTWLLTQNPDLRIVTASYGQSLANRNGRAIRNRITAHPELGLKIAPDHGAVHEWSLDGHEGGVLSVGVGAGVTGRAADCVSGDTYIDCEYGRITAAEAFERGITRILAYDHTAGRAVWGDVEASRRIPGRRVVEVVTTSGRRLTCTSDHRVYSGRGYLPAGSLRHGDSLVALMGAGRVPVRQPACDAEDGRSQGDTSRPEPLLLLRMSLARNGGGAAHQVLCGMRRPGPASSEGDLLRSLPCRPARPQAQAEDVSAVRGQVPASLVAHDLLLEGVCRRGSLRADGGQGQLPLQDWRELRPLVPLNASTDLAARRSPMRDLLEGSDFDLRASRQDRHPLGAGDSPHRRGRHEQSAGEPHHIVPDVPRRAPQVDRDSVAMVLDRGDGAVDVYDFQVAGARNFFADGLLVHNCLIIDDPIKDRKEADSKTYRDNVWDWWTDASSARLAPGAPVILILTRWHHDDLAGRLLAQDDGWVLINIPAEADHRPEKGETDPLGREPGEFMISARGRTTAQWAKRKRTAGPRTWASLYQGRPTPDSGNLFPADAWARYTQPLWIVRPDGSRVVPEAGRDPNIELIQSWDFTFKDTKSSDFVVGQIWLRRGTKAYLLDQVRRRAAFAESCQMMLDLTARWPQAILKLVEDKANGPAILNALRAKVGGLVPVEPEGSKYARAAAITPFTQAGDVVLPDPLAPALMDDDGHSLTPWVVDLTEEARDFPNATNDDTVDGMSQAVHRLLLVPILDDETHDVDDVLDDEDGGLAWVTSIY